MDKRLNIETKPQHVFMPADGLGNILPPVETRHQELPLNSLSWEDFERLCFRMAGKNNQAEYWQRYGRQGQAQDAIEIQTQCLKKEGITFHVDGAEKLSEKLKAFPDLVDDFFGRAWLKVFCADSAENDLSEAGHHLDGVEISRLRHELFNFYNEYFQTVDRGLIGSTSQAIDTPPPPSLLDRFIVPDVMIKEFTSSLDTSTQSDPAKSEPKEVGEYETPSAQDEGLRHPVVTTNNY